jgi:mRNA-degrading endonuclease YafQ of YafQ-DinJ toxin-antitoxin module
VTYDYRIVLIVIVTAQEVILLDIGSHNEGYRA